MVSEVDALMKGGNKTTEVLAGEGLSFKGASEARS